MRSLVTLLTSQMILSNQIIDHIAKALEAQYEVLVYTLIQMVSMAQLIVKAVFPLTLQAIGLYLLHLRKLLSWICCIYEFGTRVWFT